jgi:hypothetical protein
MGTPPRTFSSASRIGRLVHVTRKRLKTTREKVDFAEGLQSSRTLMHPEPMTERPLPVSVQFGAVRNLAGKGERCANCTIVAEHDRRISILRATVDQILPCHGSGWPTKIGWSAPTAMDVMGVNGTGADEQAINTVICSPLPCCRKRLMNLVRCLDRSTSARSLQRWWVRSQTP